MKLYTNPFSRGVTVEWYIKELGADVELVTVDMYGSKEHKSADFLAINPMGRVPALRDGDLVMSESGAILLYLWQQCGGGDKASPVLRGKVLQWVLFTNSTLEEAVFGPKKDQQRPEVFEVLDKLLSQTAYIAGDDFTVADVALASSLIWMPAMAPEAKADGYKHITAYLDRVKARQACKDTLLKSMGAPMPHMATPHEQPLA